MIHRQFCRVGNNPEADDNFRNKVDPPEATRYTDTRGTTGMAIGPINAARPDAEHAKTTWHLQDDEPPTDGSKTE